MDMWKNKSVKLMIIQKRRNSSTSCLKNPEFGWLNPHVVGGMGSGGGKNSPRKEKKPLVVKEPVGKRQSSKRSGSGVRITFVSRPNDNRDGWVDVDSDAFVCNEKHPLYSMYDKNIQARNQRAKSVIFSSLIKHANKKKAINLEEAFNLHTKLMTYAKKSQGGQMIEQKIPITLVRIEGITEVSMDLDDF